MKFLILGATGLIGHSIYRVLTRSPDEVWGTTRREKQSLVGLDLFEPDRCFYAFDATDLRLLDDVIKTIRPDVVLNCIGITKRRPEINNMTAAIRVNALYPHRLHRFCEKHAIRLIHFSTDCVFDGKSGPYTEDSPTTPVDTYGRTKALGEILSSPSLTIRSSFLGREIFDKSEMLEWFLSTKEARGYSNVWYSGVSTLFLARTIRTICHSHPNLTGLYQLSTVSPTNKFELLSLAKDAFGWRGRLREDPSVSSRPTLDGSLLADEIQLVVPPWSEMMQELARETFPTGPYVYTDD